MRFWARASGWLMWFGGASAFAQVPAAQDDTLSWQYAAPVECPDRATFVARVLERRTSRSGSAPVRLEARIVPTAEGFVGELDLAPGSAAAVNRRVHGEQCDALVTSLALITALTLDASSTGEAAAETSVATVAVPPPLVPPRPQPEPPPPQAEARPSAAAAAPPLARAAPRRLEARVGAAAGYDAPLRAFSFGLLGQLDWQQRVAFRLMAHIGSSERTLDERRAELRLIGVETSVCPKLWQASRFALYPCALADLGWLSAEGVPGGKLVSADSATSLWVGVGAGLRLAWEPSATFWVELHGRALFPLVSHEFVFEQPSASVYQVKPPKISAGGGVAAGVRFGDRPSR